MLGTSYFFIDNESGYGEGIDRFVMPRGMFAPRISVIGCADFSDSSHKKLYRGTPVNVGIYSTSLFSTKTTRIHKRLTYACAL